MKTALLVNAGNRHQFAVGSAKARLPPICCQQQLVIGSNFNGAALVDIKAFRLLCCELALFAACVAGNDLAVLSRFTVRSNCSEKTRSRSRWGQGTKALPRSAAAT